MSEQAPADYLSEAAASAPVTLTFHITMSRTYHETIHFEVEAETVQAALALAYEREDPIAFDWEQITESEREVRAIYSSTGERVYSADVPEAASSPIRHRDRKGRIYSHCRLCARLGESGVLESILCNLMSKGLFHCRN